eukprot:165566-Chlamydomonas_euryale.AAC.4
MMERSRCCRVCVACIKLPFGHGRHVPIRPRHATSAKGSEHSDTCVASSDADSGGAMGSGGGARTSYTL